MILTGRQFREGRLLAGMAMMRKPDAVALQAVLEGAGVEFIPENGGGAGVRLRKADKGEGI